MELGCFDVPKGATGVWTLAGEGFCLDCGLGVAEADFDSWDFDGDIVCDNCNKDTIKEG